MRRRGDPRREQRLSRCDDAHGRQEVLGQRVLQEEPAGTRTQRLVHVLVDVERREDQHPGPIPRLGVGHDPPGRLEPVHRGHADVHQHHVRALTRHQVDGLSPVRGLTHDFDVLGRAEQHREPAPDQGLIVRHRYPDHRVAPVSSTRQGSTAVTRNPPPEAGPAERVPP